MRFRKILGIILALALLTGCKAQPDQSGFLWQISLLQAELTDDLYNTQTFVRYDGSKEDVDFRQSPSAGCRFLLLELRIAKSDVGKGKFSWKDLYVEDPQGNRYFRMENDSFLADYEIPRLKATELVTGSAEGFLCVEVPEDLELKDLQLVHEAAEGRNVLPVS